MEESKIEVIGARVHNLKNVNVTIPRNALTVITGLSGSGKSSLAFDTIYAEGQRRYMETLSAYARQFVGSMERPDVEQITGLSPVISIEQKTTSKNPRSTVGTTTEIYDFLRLLFARASVAYSKNTGEQMVRYTDEQITDLITEKFAGQKLLLLAPIVKGRKGHYKELFDQLGRKGYLSVRVDGEVREIRPGMKLDRYKTHFVELVVDKVVPSGKAGDRKRLLSAIVNAMQQGGNTIMALSVDTEEMRFYSRHLMCPTTGIAYNEPAPHTFSFNSPQGACPRCNGLGVVAEADVDKIIPNRKNSIRNGGIAPLGTQKTSLLFAQLEAIAKKFGFSLSDPIESIPADGLEAVLYGTQEGLRIDGNSIGVASSYQLSFEGVLNVIANRHEHDDEPSTALANRYISHKTCPACHGMRLKEDVLFFKVADRNIAELSAMDVEALAAWFGEVEQQLTGRQRAIATEIVKEIRNRLSFLLDVGLGYLSLNRSSASLSGGESQRIRLATQVGSKLVNVLYILDEPSIGLHQRDNIRLIASLKRLRDEGNSVIVVEHDEEMMRAADWVVDVGPGAGTRGGKIIFQGKIGDLPPASPKKSATGDGGEAASLTLQYLRGEKTIPVPAARREGSGASIVLKGATGNNLKNVTLELPLGKFICVTGVSGSGKSSLINETLQPILSQHFYRSLQNPLPYKEITGVEHIDKIVEVDQSPIGRTPRSNPATYTGVFGDIRKLFEATPDAKIRGYKAGRFSFNVKGGRCEECRGAGIQTIEMNFLPDVYVTCKTCNGKRYNRETLAVRYKGKNISDVLEMTIDQAAAFFENIPSISRSLKAMQSVGLGYVTLGQSGATLSGGESQRLKLSSELAKRDTGKTLYVFDEPTTGLHFEDVRVLLEVFNKLVERGNTIVVIEHNMDVIKVADHIIDLGPEGGAGGGKILCAGTPEEICRHKKSYTAQLLAKIVGKKA
ncbi:MAG: excinuclease ABC subunit UvrA [Prevotellaceae bacterium]|jgi:excinuclease ABC subunit A|nr:excinuclease ABC subunit UvrA [Prevotellaceae bacterium]